MSARKPAGAPRITREQPREQPVQGNVYFLQLPIPSRSDPELITHAVELRVLLWLRRRGLLRASSDDARDEVTDRSALDACLQGSLGVGELVALGGADPDETNDGQVSAERALSVSAAHRAKGSRGFDIHAAVAVPAADRDGRERLLRYCARAPLSLDRLSVLPDDRIAYRIKAPRGKQTHRVMTPLQFLARLCALIPPPRHPLVRFHVVFGPHSAWRHQVVALRAPIPTAQSDRELAPPEKSNRVVARPALVAPCPTTDVTATPAASNPARDPEPQIASRIGID